MNRNRLARTAGLLYIVIAVTSGPAQFFRESLLVAGDPGATAAKVRDNADMLRLALAADLIGIAAFLGVAVALYFLFREVGPLAATAMFVIVGVSAAVQSADLFNHAGALIVATQPGYSALGFAGNSDSLVMLFLELHKQGFFVAQVFFGLWLIPLGYLVWRSAWFPRLLGAALAFGGACYLVALVPVYASSTLDSALSVPITLPAGLAEIAFAVWLAFVGLNARGKEIPR